MKWANVGAYAMKQVRKDRFYILQKTPGISGFQRWHEREYRVVNGAIAQHRRIEIVSEFKWHGGTFRLEDGHLPEYCPTTDNPNELVQWLRGHNKAFMLNPELYGLPTII